MLQTVFAVVFAGYGATAVVVARTRWADLWEDVQHAVNEASAMRPPWEQLLSRYFGAVALLIYSVIRGLCWPLLLYRHLIRRNAS
ncbi:hypothetical protein Airi01_074610 [Actinoallomurus iriomotensis]|uniref:Uncharacterized protein n=1 Tax=Actinoallomurus iriomotensis TaxID=478107 RepID=A0A9W6VTJ4_9ACTN|nr:hypothetical protein Airi01_074610 [Actinoallomurus iriomotensis]